MESLSPWEDGSADRSSDQRTRGDRNSDRQLFGRWYLRYAQHEQTTEHRRDYQPFPIPSTIGEAIDDKRRYEAREAAAQQRADAERKQLEAHQKVEQDEQRRQRLARDQAELDANRMSSDQRQGNNEADDAAIAPRIAQDRAAAASATERYQCRMRREKAAADAQTANTRGVNEDGVYQRVWDSFHCRED